MAEAGFHPSQGSALFLWVKPGLFQVKLAGSFDAEWVKLGFVKGLHSLIING